MEESTRTGRPVQTVQSSYRRTNHPRGGDIKRPIDKNPYPKKPRYLRKKSNSRSRSRLPHPQGRSQEMRRHKGNFNRTRSDPILSDSRGHRNVQEQERKDLVRTKDKSQRLSKPSGSEEKAVVPDDAYTAAAISTKSNPSDFPQPLTAQKENNQSDISPTASYDRAGGKRRRCRRKRKAGDHHQVGRTTRWKPYDMLTWQECKALEEKERKRATTRVEEQMANGQAMAPYNTTQFLMDQHTITGTPPELRAHIKGKIGVKAVPARARIPSGSLTAEDNESLTTDDNYSSVGGIGGDGDAGDDYETMFLQKDFADAYNNFRAERLDALTREELLREYLDVEVKLEGVYSRLNEMCSATKDLTPSESEKQDPVLLVREEMERLRSENAKLIAEIEQLKKSTACGT